MSCLVANDNKQTKHKATQPHTTCVRSNPHPPTNPPIKIKTNRPHQPAHGPRCLNPRTEHNGGTFGESWEVVDQNVLRILHYVNPKPTRFVYNGGACACVVGCVGVC